jgi:drug/metabolite transporter (DMT)-like permease
MTEAMHRRGFTGALLLLLAVLWGSQWMLDASLLRGLPPLATGALSCLLAGMVLLPFAWRARGRLRSLRLLRDSVLIGAGLIAVPQLLLGLAGARAGFADRAAIFAAVPLMVASSSARTRSLLPLCVAGFAGIALVVADALTLTWRALPVLLAVVAAAVVIAAMLVFAQSTFADSALGKSVRNHTVPLAASVCIQMLCAGALLAIAALISLTSAGSPQVLHGLWPLDADGRWGIALGAMVTGGGYLLLFSVLRVLPAAKVAAVQWLQTLVTVAEAAWLFGQRPGWQMLLGALVAMGSLVLLLQASEDADRLTLRITGDA